ncbi:hypothetical protein ON064_17080 [Planococcus sp. A6]|uniref:hypothetical protein n=1 Tax=Planococcus sp. A6 TaxID=2992760 RepID=UPI00237B103C|nr:hypothetical protein [Planococcus sp. A6]MDE0584742.1 hypothetical protein [Planococcus sp. A6]
MSIDSISTSKLYKIYEEFSYIQHNLTNYTLNITETEKLLQIEFKNPTSVKDLKALRNLSYFETFVVGESNDIAYFILAIDDPKRNMTIDYLKNRRVRVKLDKSDLSLNLNGIDFLFFTSNYIVEFLEQLEDQEINYKINIGVYGIESFSTPLINFIGLTSLPTERESKIPIKKERLEMLNRLLRNTEGKFTKLNNPLSFYPEEIELVNINDLPELKIKLIQRFYHSFLEVISYKVDNEIYDIRGKKKIFISTDDNFSTVNHKVFYDLLIFLFRDDKFLEKFLILKNVMTRYINDKETLSNLDTKIIEIEKTVNYYFEKYVQDDLEVFFENRDTVYKEAINMSKSINEQNDKVNSYLNTSLISTLVLALSFIFKSLISLNNSSLIFANVFLISFSIIFYNFISRTSNERFSTIEKQFNLFLNKMGIILEDEKIDINQTFIINPKNDLFSNVARIKTLLFYSNIFLVIITIVTILYSNFDEIQAFLIASRLLPK